MILAKVVRRAAGRQIWKQIHRPYSSAESPTSENKGQESVSKKTRVVFSGIQPTGVPHLGNYLGALRPWVNLQDQGRDGDCTNFCVVDLHALTVKQDAGTLSRWRRESYASLLAVGLNPQKSIIFFQSDVSAHSELMWLLSTVASTGYLSRMTQWKSKLDLPDYASLNYEASADKLKLGLFSYPVLQAADILLYDTTHVPIGADQIQHLEFTRNIAKGFNSLYGHESSDVFRQPEAIVSPAKRIMSLKDPTKKMSKSDPNPSSRILITDSPDTIRKKINNAVTDSEDGISYEIATRPGISNLVDILKHSSESDLEPSEIAQQHERMSKKAFKELVADAVITTLAGIRDKYENLLSDPQTVDDAARKCAARAREIAATKMKSVRKAMGIYSDA